MGHARIDRRAAALQTLPAVTGPAITGRIMVHRIILSGLAAAVLSSAASAQAPNPANTPPEGTPVIDAQPASSQEIVVEAPRQVKTPGSAEPFTGEGFMATTVKIPVLYSDLDLTKEADAARLMTRIERVASDACHELDRVYPLDPDPDCVSRAQINGRKAAQAVIDAARGARP